MEQEAVVKRFKSFVDANDLSGAQLFLAGIAEDETVPWDYVYQKVYLHACLKKRRDFVAWMDGLFEVMEPIQRIALRQMFAYGRYLLQK
jgi:hypothetical protein